VRGIARAGHARTCVWSAPGLADGERIPCPVVDRRRFCPEHEAALRACVATRAAVARGEQRFRLRTPASRSALGLPGRFAIPMPAMRARLPDRRVHRGHLAPAGCDGVRGVCHGATAVNPLSRARRGGTNAVLGERPRLASGPDPRRKHRPARRHVRSPQLASRPSTRELRASQPASSSLIGRRLSSPAITGMPPRHEAA
jgi:hypothetical protein